MKKGFTLIELLAVIVILAVIAVIATPIVLNAINSAKEGAAKDSAYSYMNALEYYIASTYNDDNPNNDFALSGTLSTEEMTTLLNQVSVKGTQPDILSGVVLSNGKVTSATIGVNGYTVTVSNGEVTDVNEYVGFSCGDAFTDSRDGKSYTTTQVGTQCWFAQDLAYDNGCLSRTWAASAPFNACVNQTSGYSGILYQWDAAMGESTTEKSQGACPSGWHVPSDAEWITLEISAGMSADVANQMLDRGSPAGQKLRSITWYGDNETGLNVVASGLANATTGVPYNVGTNSYFWTSTISQAGLAYRRAFYNSQLSIHRFAYTYRYGNSVRCIQD